MHLLVSERKKGSVLAGIMASLFLLFSLKSPSPLLNKIILAARLLKMLAVLKRVSKNYLVPFELGFGPMQKSTGRAWPGSLSGAVTWLSLVLSIRNRSSPRQRDLALLFLFAGTLCPNTQNNQSSKLFFFFSFSLCS